MILPLVVEHTLKKIKNYYQCIFNIFSLLIGVVMTCLVVVGLGVVVTSFSVVVNIVDNVGIFETVEVSSALVVVIDDNADVVVPSDFVTVVAVVALVVVISGVEVSMAGVVVCSVVVVSTLIDLHSQQPNESKTNFSVTEHDPVDKAQELTDLVPSLEQYTDLHGLIDGIFSPNC